MNNSNNEKYIVDFNTKDINIREFLEIIKRRFWIIILITILATAGGYLYSNSKNQNYTPLYETSTRIIIESDEGYMSTLMVMIKDPIIMENVKNELHLSQSPESIASQIEVSRIDESRVIMVSVKNQDPVIAANIANQTAKAFKSEAKKILDFKDVQLLSEAKPNNIPINSKNKDRIVIIALVVGLVVGIGLVFLIDSLDESVEKENDVEKVLGVPVIGVISNMKSKKALANQKKQKKVEWRESNVGSEQLTKIKTKI